MSGPDCEVCGEHFLSCHCDNKHRKVAEIWQSILCILCYANEDEAIKLVKVFAEIARRIADEKDEQE